MIIVIYERMPYNRLSDANVLSIGQKKKVHRFGLSGSLFWANNKKGSR